MPVVDNIIGIVRGINDRKRAANVNDALGNYLDDPDAAIQAVMPHDARLGMSLSEQLQDRRLSTEEAARKRRLEDAGLMGKYFRSIDPNSDVGAAIDNMAPYLTDAVGLSPDAIMRFREAAVANPSMLAGLDDNAFKAMAEDRYTTKVGAPGSHFVRGGQVTHKVPYPPKVENTPAGTISRVFDPNTGQYVVDSAPAAPAQSGAAPAMGGELTVDMLRPHFVAQESGGDYTAVNSETGALGAYQVMPQTGQSLAKRVGVAWRPDLMRSDTPEARKYQDAIGGAAIQEAIDASGGDPGTAFSYYYGGSDRGKWGPRTRQYEQDMMRRIGGGGQGGAPAAQAVATPTTTYNPPAKAAKAVRAARPEELPPGATYAQVDETGKLINIRYPTEADRKAENAGETIFDTAILDGALESVNVARDLADYAGAKAKLFADVPVAGAWMGREERETLEAALQQIKGINIATLIQAVQDSGASVSRLMDAKSESDTLSSAVAAISPDQSPKTLRANLDKAERAINNLYALAKPPASERQQSGAAPVGTVIRMPDGSRQRKTANGWEPIR